MEVRKLISFGSSSYVVSLPKTWVDNNKLAKGDSIYIEEKPNELVLTINHENKEKEIREKQIDASNKTIRRIESEIVSAYINNYDIIEIRNLKDNSNKVKDIIQNFAGLEILEQTATKIVARDLININEVSIKALIRRVDIILRSMIEDALHCVSHSGLDIERIHLNERDNDINRLVYLISRMAVAAIKNPKIAKKFNTTSLEIISDLEVAKKMEIIGDNVKRFVRHIESTKDEKSFSEACRILGILRDKYLILMKAYYSKDINTAFDIETTSKEIFAMCDKVFENNPSKHMIFLIIHLKAFMNSLRIIARSIMLESQ
ncbi:MAG: AbrB/MazE/SpoVT family DNA-binding domain-containing protein [Candidatus Woesearchaeota archaeon]